MRTGYASHEWQRGYRIPLGRRGGFTLIEVLVVVAIIALLVAILLPSLSRARTQARVVTCATNAQQIGRMVMQYTAEQKGYVPVVLNYAAHGTNLGSVPNIPVPARAASLSIALRGYGKRPSPQLLDRTSNFYFDKSWNNATLLQYEKTMMPECFACPFGRGGERAEFATITPSWILYTITGQTESYDTWRWQGHYPGRDVIQQYGGWPGPRAPSDGVVQYGSFSWNRGGWDDGMYKGNNMKPDVINASRRWEISDGRFVPNSANPVPIGQPSVAMVSWCILGESMDWQGSGSKWTRVNLGGHRGALGGGTNAMFADGHVKWVKGTRLGWP
jgi:prepilin-type N-terminal cleavage/methylation domain-containing protein/prepilin-type processing-associated H-X9-DG protein